MIHWSCICKDMNHAGVIIGSFKLLFSSSTVIFKVMIQRRSEQFGYFFRERSAD